GGWICRREAPAPAGKMADRILLALSTFPDAEKARRISHQLGSERFAPCAKIMPSVESFFLLKGRIEFPNETLVLLTARDDRHTAFQDKLRSVHPYDVPEIIFVPVASGLPEYLRWVVENCG